MDRLPDARHSFLPHGRSRTGIHTPLGRWEPEGEADYAALASLVDRRVKQGASTAAFAFLAIAALVVLIFFGVR